MTDKSVGSAVTVRCYANNILQAYVGRTHSDLTY